MPSRVANLFAFGINSDYIVILGGMRKKDLVPKESKKAFELDNRCFALKTSSMKWKDLKAFPFKKKFGSIAYNGFGKFFCNVIEDNKELPQLFVYDVRSCFPHFDKYWETDRSQGLQKIRGKDIKVHVAYSLSMKQERHLGIRTYDLPDEADRELCEYTGEPLPGDTALPPRGGKPIELTAIGK